MKLRFSNSVFGIFLLLAAVFVLVNQFIGFISIGIGSIIVAVLALTFLVLCIAHLCIAFLPMPLALLYIIFQMPLELPYIKPWTIILASVLASVGLAILLPKKHWNIHSKDKHFSRSGNNHPQMTTENGEKNNNPAIYVNMGNISRHLYADNLETAHLSCDFGELDIFFDKVELNPNGADINIYCNFGNIKLFIPKSWKITDHLNCSFGSVNINKCFFASAENAPKIKLTGKVSFGNIKVESI
jgi:predicted membrane protein